MAVAGDAAARLPALLRPLAADPARAALFLDFDGTLAAIVADPTGARPLPGVPALLSELAAMFALVAVVSGRPTAFLADVLGEPEGVTLAGLYGLERALRGPEHDAWAAVVDEVVREARAEAPEGVYVEPKGLTVTLHWRGAPEHRDWVIAFAERASTRSAPWRCTRAVTSVSCGPRSRSTRGRSCATLAAEHAGQLRAVAVFGDDMGDLPAFAAAARADRARRPAAHGRQGRSRRRREPARWPRRPT